MALNREERRRRIHYRIRKHVNGTPERPRLAVFRSNKQIYAQVIDDEHVWQMPHAKAASISNQERLWQIQM